MNTKEKIAAMQQVKAAPPMSRIFKNSDGTWGNKYNFNARFDDKSSAEADARFCEDWGRK